MTYYEDVERLFPWWYPERTYLEAITDGFALQDYEIYGWNDSDVKVRPTAITTN